MFSCWTRGFLIDVCGNIGAVRMDPSMVVISDLYVEESGYL